MKEPFLTYLACPYTHPDPKVRLERFNAASDATVVLMRAFKWNVFSPITHSHPLHERGLDGDWRFWERMDTEYLEASRRLVVLTLPGWRSSVGIGAESRIANRLGLSISYMSRPVTTRSTDAKPGVLTGYEETRFYFAPVPPPSDYGDSYSPCDVVLPVPRKLIYE